MAFFNRNDSGNAQDQNSQQQQQSQQQQSGSENNTETNLNPFARSSDNAQSPGGTNAQQSQQQQQQQPADRTAQVRDYYRQTGLYNDLDYGKFIDAVREGDAESATEFVNNMLENAVRVSINAANKLVEANVSRAIEDAVDQSTATTRNELALGQLVEEMEFLNDESVRPVAENVLNGFLAQGMSVRAALDASKKYFEKTISQGAQHFGFEKSNPRNQRPGARSFADSRPARPDNQNNSGAASGQEPDWVNILTSGNQHAEG